jgi:hypothetical protein
VTALVDGGIETQRGFVSHGHAMHVLGVHRGYSGKKQ